MDSFLEVDTEGTSDGTLEGDIAGVPDGCTEGAFNGVVDSVLEGDTEATSDGTLEAISMESRTAAQKVHSRVSWTVCSKEIPRAHRTGCLVLAPGTSVLCSTAPLNMRESLS